MFKMDNFEKIKELFYPYTVTEIKNTYNNGSYSIPHETYDIEFNEMIILKTHYYDGIYDKRDLLIEEFEKINLRKLETIFKNLNRPICYRIHEDSLINLHIPINLFNLRKYEKIDTTKIQILNFIRDSYNKLNFAIELELDKKILTFDNIFVPETIIFGLNDSEGRVFSKCSINEKIKLLYYYCKIYGLEKELLFNIERILLAGWSIEK